MIFELISWIYISLVCLAAGNRILKLFLWYKRRFSNRFPGDLFPGYVCIRNRDFLHVPRGSAFYCY